MSTDGYDRLSIGAYNDGENTFSSGRSHENAPVLRNSDRSTPDPGCESVVPLKGNDDPKRSWIGRDFVILN